MMAQVEPMDIDAIESDFDDKENTFHHSNVLSRTPCTEKGYEELDVSELNMKLRYSVTPASSPMSKSLTGPFLDNRSNLTDDCLNNSDNGNLTRSLNSTLTRTEHVTKSKVLPLQTLSADPFVDSNRNTSIRRLIDPKDNNITISVSTNEIDDNLSLPSTSSSIAQTPEATTPTKEIPKPEGSPILRGLKSVLSMFRSSQSPIPPIDDKTPKQDVLSPIEFEILTSHKREIEEQTVQVSTPLATDRQKEGSSSRRSSPLKESVVFNDGLERELQWKDEPKVMFKQEKIPVNKLFFRNPITEESLNTQIFATDVDGHSTTAEYMDISCNESIAADKDAAAIERPVNSIKNAETVVVESDNEFLDCETTFSKNDSYTTDNKVEIGNNNTFIGNLTVDLTSNVPMVKMVESDYKSNLNTTEVINLCTVDLETSENSSNSLVDVMETKSNSYKIIEATRDFLKSETYINDNVLYSAPSPTENINLENESLIISHHSSEDCNATRVIDHKIVNNEDRTLDVMGTGHTIDNFITNEVQERSDSKVEDAEITLESGERQIDILPDVCPVSSNTESYPEDSPSDTTYTEKLDKHIELIEVNSSNGNKKDTMAKPDDSDNASEKAEGINSDLSAINIQKHDKTEGRHIDSEIPADNVLKVCALSCSESVADDHAIINAEVNEDMSVTEYTGIESCIPLNATCVIDTICTVIPSNSEFNCLIGNVNPMKLEGESTCDISNHNNTTNILSISKEDHSQSISITEAVENDCVLSTINPTNIPMKNVPCMDNDRDVCEMIVESNMFRKSPSEVPLPDEEDLEQDIKVNNYIAEKASSVQDKICDESFTVNERASSEKWIDSHFIPTENPEQENAKGFIVSFIDQNKSETIKNTNESDLSELKACIIQNQDDNNLKVTKSEIAEDGAIVMPSVNLTPEINDKLEMCDLQNANNTICVEDAIEAIKHENIPEINSINTICDTTIVLADNGVVIDITLNNADTKLVEENSPRENIDSEPINDIEELTRNEVLLDKNMQQGNELENTVEKVEEELITSANNSPYVSVTDLALDMESNSQVTETYLQETLEEIKNPFATKTKIASSPPISPKIISKGYNFNFDDIDDPFATKTNIRMSPTPDTPGQCCNTFEKEIKKQEELPKKINNRRKPQPERKRFNQKKNVNSTSNSHLSKKDNISKTNMKQSLGTLQDKVLDNVSPPVTQYIPEPNPEDSVTVITENSESFTPGADETKTYKETINSFIQKEEIHPIETERKLFDHTTVVATEKSTSSSEQYFSLGTSSSESVGPLHSSRNVFNLPEIDDVNFNPFATKSKMRMSPPPLAHNNTISTENKNSATESTFVMEQKGDYNITITKDPDAGDVTFNKITPMDSSQNTSNATCSSNHTNDKDDTVREVLTEDEDTIEGPFLDADELKEIEKLTHLDIERDMMNFNAPHPPEKDQNLDNGELFIDADAFEFLLNKNKSTTVSDSGKESLFLKFDPLFANRVSSDGVLAALSKVQKRQSTPKKITAYAQKDVPIENPIAGPSNCKESYIPVDEYTDDIASTMTKPMMVVNPAVNSIVTPRKCTPKLNRRSLTFTSPAMAVIDRLLSLSGNSPHLNHDTSIPQHTETDLAITQLRELLAEKEIHVHNLRSESKELKDRLAALEIQLRCMETESKERLAKINELNERVSEKTKINKSMATVVEEYERTIASLIAESEQDKKRNAEERMRLIRDRDEQTAHLASMEVSFSDLHSKYEKSKQIILVCKSNEDTYKKSIREFEENFTKMQNNYELLKQHATSKLNYANQELEKMNRAHEAEVLKLNAMIKRKDLHITSLEETLAQKTKANEELTAICDELINKV